VWLSRERVETPTEAGPSGSSQLAGAVTVTTSGSFVPAKEVGTLTFGSSEVEKEAVAIPICGNSGVAKEETMNYGSSEVGKGATTICGTSEVAKGATTTAFGSSAAEKEQEMKTCGSSGRVREAMMTAFGSSAVARDLKPPAPRKKVPLRERTWVGSFAVAKQ